MTEDQHSQNHLENKAHMAPQRPGKKPQANICVLYCPYEQDMELDSWTTEGGSRNTYMTPRCWMPFYCVQYGLFQFGRLYCK